MMERTWPRIQRAIRAVLICAVLAALLVIGIFGSFLLRSANYGFGPQWDCESPTGRTSALTCIKRTP